MEDKWNLFQKFLIVENENISIEDFLINSVLVVILCGLLGWTYQKVAKSLSNKKDFSSNFMVLAFTTMLIITIVKSSLALSLGLVGALSIVRFRAAIKEPEELSFLFFAIAIGLGLGANQVTIVLIAFAVFMAILWGRHLVKKKESINSIFLNIDSDVKDGISLDKVTALLKAHFKKHQLKRFDEQNESVEMSFVVEAKKSEDLEKFRNELRGTYPNSNLSFLDNKSY
ncbi:DUF4956 domain-containing protein [Cryomorphaceae bacterium 1068]|nr:DUF4956 domain-containing protein [Cryomorphaceae bacterium 1068]